MKNKKKLNFLFCLSIDYGEEKKEDINIIN